MLATPNQETQVSVGLPASSVFQVLHLLAVKAKGFNFCGSFFHLDRLHSISKVLPKHNCFVSTMFFININAIIMVQKIDDSYS